MNNVFPELIYRFFSDFSESFFFLFSLGIQ